MSPVRRPGSVGQPARPRIDDFPTFFAEGGKESPVVEQVDIPAREEIEETKDG